MIELYSRTIQLRAPDGRTLLCDPERLQADLRNAFAAAGVTESWPAEQVLAVIRQQATMAGTLSDGEDEADVDRLVGKLLIDAGYPEVASSYAASRGVPTPPDAARAERRPWDAARLESVIVPAFGASAPLAEKLVDVLANKLHLLAFLEVSDNLILQLAEHILAGLAQTYRSPPNENAGWLMPPGYWEAFFSGRPARFVVAGAITIHPVSELFPVLRMTVDAATALDQLAAEGDGAAKSSFPNVWEACCAVVVEAISCLLAEAGDLVAGNRHHPLLVHVATLDQAVAKTGRIAKKKRRAIAGEAVARLGETLKTSGLNAIVSTTQ